MTLLERCESLCRALDKAAGSDRLGAYDLDAIRDALTSAMADAWDEGMRASSRLVRQSDGGFVRPTNPYRSES